MRKQHYLSIQGALIPALGFGTYKLLGNDCYASVRDAVDIGYRHVDTAAVYHNEVEVGKAIRESGIPRKEIFLTTKLSFREAAPEKVTAAFAESLKNLGLEYVDLWLLHWPNPLVPLEDTLTAMLEIKESGRARYIGVSNFPPGLLMKALNFCPLLCIQVEYHPFLSQTKLLQITEQKGMMLTAYSPLAQGRMPHNGTLGALGEKYHKTTSQIALRWLVQQKNVAAIPRTNSHLHRAENFDIWDFELSLPEMDAVTALKCGMRVVNPAHAPDWNFE